MVEINVEEQISTLSIAFCGRSVGMLDSTGLDDGWVLMVLLALKMLEEIRTIL